MEISSDAHEAPPELEDALDRIDQAKDNYVSLVHEMNEFLYNYVKGMVKGQDPVTGDFKLQIRHPRESIVKGRPRILVGQIVENLRSALDYMVFQLSTLHVPDLNERKPQFVISDSEKDFKRQARTHLRYLTDEQRSFVEQIQPYHGNGMLALLGQLAIVGKHRHLLSIQSITGFDIYFAEMAKKHEFEGYFVYPVEQQHAIFARPKGEGTVVLMEAYDAMPTLKSMIEHTADIVRVSYCFFEERPLELKILKA